MKLNLQFISSAKSKFNIKNTAETLASFWKKFHVFIFFFFLFSLIALGGYFWQQSLYGSGWSNEKKQEYYNSQDKGVIFRQGDFQNAIDDIQLRKEESLRDVEPLKDIFQPYKGMATD
jgi:hypothetical protein